MLANFIGVLDITHFPFKELHCQWPSYLVSACTQKGHRGTPSVLGHCPVHKAEKYQ